MKKRYYVSKKAGFQNEEVQIQKEVNEILHIEITQPKIYQVYDVFELEKEEEEIFKRQVISENNVDIVEEEIERYSSFICSEPILGAYDQRADSCEQCLKFIIPSSKIKVKTGRYIGFKEELKKEELERIKRYYMNPLEVQEKDLTILDSSFHVEYKRVEDVEGFINFSKEELKEYKEVQALAMNLEDVLFIQEYFRKEDRNPTEAEIKVLDTYWSDHCRHTTFESSLVNLDIKEGSLKKRIEDSFNSYLELRKEVGREDKKISFMDMASIYARYFKKVGKGSFIEESEEVNACGIEVEVEIDGVKEPWLVLYKNETHNHPTEIEPFGGAATCIGGAIRDPLSGRAYVYQAMRISGAGDISEAIEHTREHKLPQVQISKGAALGYSSYGNQIGLATSYVKELFDEGFVAKRMEVGAVVGAVPKKDMKRESCCEGDIVVLLGGATGRDGIGGATGSSSEHNEESLHTCAAQVQKGNALIERKIQRLFRNPKASILIKKANDFGAGGVCVAVGELADGLHIELDQVDTKYPGLSGVEIAISESQERMAVVLNKEDFKEFEKYCFEENLEARVIATVNSTHRLVMEYQGEIIVDLDRDFINTGGVTQVQEVVMESTVEKNPFKTKLESSTFKEQGLEVLGQLQNTNQQGLVELFDASVGRGSVVAPYGGRTRRSESMCSIHKIPTLKQTPTTTVLSYGYLPQLAKAHPYLGASYSLLEAIARQVACGQTLYQMSCSAQEYFPALRQDPTRFGQVSSAMLGLLDAQKGFECPAIGGKDSMSGSFQELDVPPSLVSFVCSVGNTNKVLVNHLQKEDSYLYYVKHVPFSDGSINYEQCKENFRVIEMLSKDGKIRSASTIQSGGVFTALAKMAFGNEIGIEVHYDTPFDLEIGSIIIESSSELEGLQYLGRTRNDQCFIFNHEVFMIEELWKKHNERFESIYPLSKEEYSEKISNKIEDRIIQVAKKRVDIPKVIIPVFPGTNSEYDALRAFEQAGASVELYPLNNLSEENIKKSMTALASKIRESQILYLAGGFSGGDEPDGSGKFMVSVLQNPEVKEAIEELRTNDGLILGICNGFQALIKSGLLPYGRLESLKEDAPTLFRNDSNKHEARFSYTKTIPSRCVFTQHIEEHSIHLLAFSHGEGKLVASREQVEVFSENGQIVNLYSDYEGNLTGNFNGSSYGVEGLCSSDGRIYGKMGHSERYEEGLYLNLEGNKEQPIFRNAVRYFQEGEH